MIVIPVAAMTFVIFNLSPAYHIPFCNHPPSWRFLISLALHCLQSARPVWKHLSGYLTKLFVALVMQCTQYLPLAYPHVHMHCHQLLVFDANNCRAHVSCDAGMSTKLVKANNFTSRWIYRHTQSNAMSFPHSYSCLRLCPGQQISIEGQLRLIVSLQKTKL